jgi:hypothetical protein
VWEKLKKILYLGLLAILAGFVVKLGFLNSFKKLLIISIFSPEIDSVYKS